MLVLDSESGALQLRRVERGLHNWSFTEITGGLEAGDVVVTSIGDEGVEAGARAVVREEMPPQ